MESKQNTESENPTEQDAISQNSQSSRKSKLSRLSKKSKTSQNIPKIHQYNWADPKKIKTFPYCMMGLVEINAENSTGEASKVYCTGTLILPNLVLTSCHALFPRVSKTKRFETKPESISFIYGWNSKTHALNTEPIRVKQIKMDSQFHDAEAKLQSILENIDQEISRDFYPFYDRFKKGVSENDLLGLLKLIDIAELGSRQANDMFNFFLKVEQIKLEIIKNDFCFLLLERNVESEHVKMEYCNRLVDNLCNRSLYSESLSNTNFLMLAYTCLQYTGYFKHFSMPNYRFKSIYEKMDLDFHEILLVDHVNVLEETEHSTLLYYSFVYPIAEGAPIFLVDKDLKVRNLIGLHSCIYNKELYANHLIEDYVNPYAKVGVKLDRDEISETVKQAEIEYYRISGLIYEYGLMGDTGCIEMAKDLMANYQGREYKKLKKINLKGMQCTEEGLVEFTKALGINEFPNLFCLDFSHNELNDDVMLVLCNGLIEAKAFNLTELLFEDNSIGIEGGREIGNLIKSLKLSKLRKLELSNNHIGYEGLRHICNGLRIVKSVHLNSLTLNRNTIEPDGLKEISLLIKDLKLNNLETLLLSANGLKTKSFEDLHSILKPEKQIIRNLKRLDISANRKIDCTSLIILSDFLKTAPFRLFELDLSGIRFDVDICKLFRKNVTDLSLDTIRKLKLAKCSLEDPAFMYFLEGFEFLEDSSLEELILARNDLNYPSVEVLFRLIRDSPLDKLVRLDLSYNYFDREVGEYIALVLKKRKLGRVKMIELEGNEELSEEDVSEIQSLLKLN